MAPPSSVTVPLQIITWTEIVEPSSMTGSTLPNSHSDRRKEGGHPGFVATGIFRFSIFKWPEVE